ncbi:hydroxyethylthiazole kinase [Alkalibaculum sp. M08DMB]|uniref:Hydroxyethylthiazole kinase n=1 Tax=Alkalibaculum sporogenes TaxID=2655001 RepID=A0A6A7KAX8_9FIRM|nr:hydroxyethylthiazole kinase [Alkalibaculum sporogenes]MPW26678.1 hydroxyethylthiazole kinase [Alkalibaculum sporogenes]
MDYSTQIAESLTKIKTSKPIVHHITNYVTMNDCANITLAIGASPIMAFDKNEVEEVVSFSSSLVLNIGTINQSIIEPMIIAGKKANSLNIPVILDPVGVGATKFRYSCVEQLINSIQFSIIKGNMSEIKSISGIKTSSKGIDSDTNNDGAEDILINLALKLKCIVCATGKVDLITDGNLIYACNNGHYNLSRITGTGCMTASLIGAFAAVSKDSLVSTLGGISSMGIAGQVSYRSLALNEGIGSFKVKLFDNIFNLTEEIIKKEVKIYEL